MSRALVPEGTVRIGKTGVVSLARDLFTSSRLALVRFDSKSGKLYLRPNEDDGIRVYKSAPGSISGTFSMMSVLKLFGLEQDVVGNMYEARIEGQELVINFRRRYVGNVKTKNGSRRA